MPRRLVLPAIYAFFVACNREPARNEISERVVLGTDSPDELDDAEIERAKNKIATSLVLQGEAPLGRMRSIGRPIALHLARAGFVVALPEHPGNNRSDNSLANTAVNLANRPRHVRLVLDAEPDSPQAGVLLGLAQLKLDDVLKKRCLLCEVDGTLVVIPRRDQL